MTMNIEKFYERINCGDCTYKYFNKEEYIKELKETKPKNKKVVLDPFVGWIEKNKKNS